MRLLALILLALAGASLAPSRAAAADPTFQVTLHRGPCFRTCASYSVSIDAGGTVTFVGPCVGPRPGRMPPSSVAALEAEIDRAGFFALNASYRSGLMDVPEYSLTVTRHGRTKTVIDRAGEMVGMPKSVHEIEAAIETAGDDRCLAPR
jgi:hypothetical protein